MTDRFNLFGLGEIETAPAKPYVTTDELRYRYPGAGDETPPGGADVHLLTKGGVCVRGPWIPDGRYLGWCPLPKRDPEKEAKL